MSATTPWKKQFVVRETKIPKTTFWRWICSVCNTLNDEPESNLVYGVCQSCQKTRTREDKILWINYIAIPRRDRETQPIFGSDEATIQENTLAQEQGRNQHHRPGGWSI